MSLSLSVSDFIAALDLVSTVIDALRETGGASAEYRELVSELLTLETALIRVKRLELGDSQSAERFALQQAASQCQRTVDCFWAKVQKYQPHLGPHTFRLKSAWVKIKWAVCKKEDLARFKADIQAHTGSIELLLLTVQMDSATIQNRKQDQTQRTLIGRIQDASFQYMNKVAVVSDSISRPMSINVFQLVCNIQNLLTKIPSQVERQQPVHLIDALGKVAPFHLEFIRSHDAFISVLKCNFSKIGSGAEKIENRESAIQETHSKRDIDLNRDWDCCFLPGQRVEMSMIFRQRDKAITDSDVCPGCNVLSEAAEDEDVECACGLVYRKSLEPPRQHLNRSSPSTIPLQPYPGGGVRKIREPLKRKRPEDAEEELRLFRRVRILKTPRKSWNSTRVEFLANVHPAQGVQLLAKIGPVLRHPPAYQALKPFGFSLRI
ncbi:hypothetical protein MMC18_001646 [Xylographa bjoerkii]|nr:hypothetical protein [Xylographa bjoerkii]